MPIYLTDLREGFYVSAIYEELGQQRGLLKRFDSRSAATNYLDMIKSTTVQVYFLVEIMPDGTSELLMIGATL